MSTRWSELRFNKILQKNGIVCLVDVVRRFEYGAIMQDVVCSLHFATLKQIWTAQALSRTCCSIMCPLELELREAVVFFWVAVSLRSHFSDLKEP